MTPTHFHYCPECCRDVAAYGDLNFCTDVERICHACLAKSFSSRVVVRPPVPDDAPTCCC